MRRLLSLSDHKLIECIRMTETSAPDTENPKSGEISLLYEMDARLARADSSVLAMRLKRLWHYPVEDFLSPAFAGFGVGIILQLLDLVAPVPVAGCGKFDRYVTGASNHVDSQTFVLGIFIFGLSLLLAGSPLSRGIRRLFVMPILRLGHHAAMFVLGVLFVFALHEHPFTSMTSHDRQAWASASLVLLMIAGELFFFHEVAAEFAARAVRYASGRLISIFIGVIFLCISAPLLTSTAHHAETAPVQCER